MKPSAPKMITWWISVILVVIGILGKLKTIPGISADMAFWLSRYWICITCNS